MAAARLSDDAAIRSRVTRNLSKTGAQWHIAAENSSFFARMVKGCCCTPNPVASLFETYNQHPNNILDYERELASQLFEQVIDPKKKALLREISTYHPSVFKTMGRAVGHLTSSITPGHVVGAIAASEKDGIVGLIKFTANQTGNVLIKEVAGVATRRFIPVRPASN